jgi:RimJ/RimL family protein N-acetyltransferase
MPRDEGQLTLELDRVRTPAELTELVDDVFEDPQARRGLGWTEADDIEEAMASIRWLFDHRYEKGWQLYEVRADDERAGIAGLGPVEDGEAWWAVYLTVRGRGLGQRVGEQLIARAEREGAREVVAATWARNGASRRMLETLGFDDVGPATYEWAEDSQLTWIEYRRELAPGEASA